MLFFSIQSLSLCLSFSTRWSSNWCEASTVYVSNRRTNQFVPKLSFGSIFGTILKEKTTTMTTKKIHTHSQKIFNITKRCHTIQHCMFISSLRNEFEILENRRKNVDLILIEIFLLKNTCGNQMFGTQVHKYYNETSNLFHCSKDTNISHTTQIVQ